ncbi:MAG: hypothetical protein EOO29_13320 [Comamonadaceae bacterium]|nr:MAG: hypothetical protein EOO29_13320 [Comamonadaceae bacterium]
MDLSSLPEPTVRAAMDAFQRGDKEGWQEQFAPGAQLYDDGSPRELEAFTREALGHELFSSLDHVSEDGLEIQGQFHSDQWGDFRTYFRFTLSGGQVLRLDIGQA